MSVSKQLLASTRAVIESAAIEWTKKQFITMDALAQNFGFHFINRSLSAMPEPSIKANGLMADVVFRIRVCNEKDTQDDEILRFEDRADFFLRALAKKLTIYAPVTLTIVDLNAGTTNHFLFSGETEILGALREQYKLTSVNDPGAFLLNFKLDVPSQVLQTVKENQQKNTLLNILVQGVDKLSDAANAFELKPLISVSELNVRTQNGFPQVKVCDFRILIQDDLEQSKILDAEQRGELFITSQVVPYLQTLVNKGVTLTTTALLHSAQPVIDIEANLIGQLRFMFSANRRLDPNVKAGSVKIILYLSCRNENL